MMTLFRRWRKWRDSASSQTSVVKQVIFHGTPSQVINLPAVVKGFVVLVLIGAIDVSASAHYPVNGLVVFAQVVAVLAGVALPFVKTAFTEIIIDSECITWRQGILTRRVSSLELCRIQDVTSVHPWWQRLFGVGFVVVMTSDCYRPDWRLPGMKDAQRLRNELNQAAIALRDLKGIRE
jgi:uncharacterized membrane protein YdbT with pleckstrin-like domain